MLHCVWPFDLHTHLLLWGGQFPFELFHFSLQFCHSPLKLLDQDLVIHFFIAPVEKGLGEGVVRDVGEGVVRDVGEGVVRDVAW